MRVEKASLRDVQAIVEKLARGNPKPKHAIPEEKQKIAQRGLNFYPLFEFSFFFFLFFPLSFGDLEGARDETNGERPPLPPTSIRIR